MVVCSEKNSFQFLVEGWKLFDGRKTYSWIKDTSVAGVIYISESTISEGRFLLSGEIDHPSNGGLFIVAADEKTQYKTGIIAEKGKIFIKRNQKLSRGSTVTGGKYNEIIVNVQYNDSLYLEKFDALKELYGSFSNKPFPAEGSLERKRCIMS